MSSESQRRRVMVTHAVRVLLLAAADGLTAGDVARQLGVTKAYVNAVLNSEYGFYVDRWATVPGGSDAAIWMCVPVPANCPRPNPKRKNT